LYELGYIISSGEAGDWTEDMATEQAVKKLGEIKDMLLCY
jgi:hypothetical protein